MANIATVHRKIPQVKKTITQIDRTKPDAFPALRSYLRGTRSIPGGTFLTGTDDKTLENNRKHRVTVVDFSIGSYPVTTDRWREYCKGTKSKMPTPPAWGWNTSHPIVNSSWQQIMDSKAGFCYWVNRVSDVEVTLPTEAQFDYAACGGQFGTHLTLYGELFCGHYCCSLLPRIVRF